MPNRSRNHRHPFAELQRELCLSDREIERRGGPAPRTLRRIRQGLPIRAVVLRRLAIAVGLTEERLRPFVELADGR